MAELAFDTLVEPGGAAPTGAAGALPGWTATSRWCWTVTPRTSASKATIRDAGGALLERVALFDLYQGQQVAAGKRAWPTLCGSVPPIGP